MSTTALTTTAFFSFFSRSFGRCIICLLATSGIENRVYGRNRRIDFFDEHFFFFPLFLFSRDFIQRKKQYDS